MTIFVGALHAVLVMVFPTSLSYVTVQNNCTCGDEVIPDAGSDKPTNTSDHSAIANQMIPPSSLQTPTKGHQDGG